MGYRLRKPTVILRATCTQQHRLLLGPEEDAPAGAERRVQVVINTGVKVYIALDIPPEDIAMSRQHMLPPLYSGSQHFRISASQAIYGMAPLGSGELEVSIICEYVEPA